MEMVRNCFKYFSRVFARPSHPPLRILTTFLSCFFFSLSAQFKFQATKLKSLLRISSHPQGILSDPDEATGLAAGMEEELPLEVNAVVSQN